FSDELARLQNENAAIRRALEDQLAKAQSDAQAAQSALTAELAQVRADAAEARAALELQLAQVTSQGAGETAALSDELSKARADAANRIATLEAELTRVRADLAIARASVETTSEDRASVEARLLQALDSLERAQAAASDQEVLRARLAATLAARQAAEADAAQKQSLAEQRAALLAKCDLESGMVYEFPELQGVMGREYALLENEDPRVATAIYEHYLPIQAGGELPSDDVGAFVSLADKMDTLCGCFCVGLIPTGTADPYALRRATIGILSIILERNYVLSIPALVKRSLELLEKKSLRPLDEVAADIIEFIRLRLVNMLTSQDYPADVVDAVLSASFNQPGDVLARVSALSQLKGREDFEPLAAAFKRVVNIIKGGVTKKVDPSLFEETCESELYEQFEQVLGGLQQQIDATDYSAALTTIAGLGPAVDAFFDGVMVMAEDEKVRTNRLALLTAVSRLFTDIADFSKISA
ncbi:MAG: glycine--tRNA ligase subunit beta, partial [Geopsychrobacter sp.]|nr:glycine--tRNA ligase subunit beta [Geopsychrobacter sp.]